MNSTSQALHRRPRPAAMDVEDSLPPKLSFYPLPLRSPEPSGSTTPPVHTACSVPFLWEESPGKPRTCTTSPPPSSMALQLHLPPRLQLHARTDMPTTVLEDRFMQASSVHGSFSFSGESSPEKDRVLAGLKMHESGRFLGSGWGRRPSGGKGRIVDVGGRGEYGCAMLSPFSPALRGDGKVRSARSTSSLSRATNQFWVRKVSICGFKIRKTRRLSLCCFVVLIY